MTLTLMVHHMLSAICLRNIIGVALKFLKMDAFEKSFDTILGRPPPRMFLWLEVRGECIFLINPGDGVCR